MLVAFDKIFSLLWIFFFLSCAYSGENEKMETTILLRCIDSEESEEPTFFTVSDVTEPHPTPQKRGAKEMVDQGSNPIWI